MIYIRVLDQFDDRIDALRREHYGKTPIDESMRDDYDHSSALYVVAMLGEECVGCVRMNGCPNNPMHAWIPNCPLPKSDGVIDLNRAVVARALRRCGLMSILLAESLMAAHRFGFKKAISAVNEGAAWERSFMRAYGSRVGPAISAMNGSAPCVVQPLEVPLAAAQQAAQEMFVTAVAQMEAAGYAVHSLVASDALTVLKRRNASTKTSFTEQAQPRIKSGIAIHPDGERRHLESARLTAAMPFAKQPSRFLDRMVGRHLVDSIAVIIPITLIYAILEYAVLKLPIDVVIATRTTIAALLLAGLGSAVAALRDLSLSRWRRRRTTLSNRFIRCHDIVMTVSVNAVLAPIVYAASGATLAQTALGTALAVGLGVVTGTITGWSIDRFRAMLGVRPRGSRESRDDAPLFGTDCPAPITQIH